MKDKEKEAYQKELDRLYSEQQSLQTQKNYQDVQSTNLSAYNNQQNSHIAEFQLNLDKELDRIYHLISGHTFIRDDEGEHWEEPQDDRLKIFSEYGIKQIMNYVSWYVHKGILLSYYTKEEYIMSVVHNFAIELSDLVFNRYEYFFHYPSPEELFDIYLPIVKKQNIDVDEEELYWKCVQWSSEELQSKYRHYSITIYAISDIVESTFRRALFGKERESLRKQIQINQQLSGDPNEMQPQHKRKLLRPGSW